MLDDQTQALLAEAVAAPAPKLWDLEPEQWRAQLDNFFAQVGLGQLDIVDRQDREVPGATGPLRSRLYRPRHLGPEPQPALLFFHGGGMVANSIDTYDALCQRLSAGSGCLVLSVDYRLAPEHRFPAGVEDAYQAAAWLMANPREIGADGARLAIGGDSAGGYLAAAVTQMMRDREQPGYAFQLLVYPAVGTRGHSRSMAEFAEGYLFDRAELDWIYETYLNDPTEARDPRACPIVARDFSGLPAAFVLTAGHDIMRDDGEHYAALMAGAGVPVELHRYETTVHPFLNMAGVIDAGARAIDECAAKVAEALGAGPAVLGDGAHARILHVLENQVTAPGSTVLRIVDIHLRDRSFAVSDPNDAAPATDDLIRVELKQPPAGTLAALDAVAVDPGRYRVEFEDETLRIVRLAFEPGEQGQLVTHPSRALVALTDVSVRVEFPDTSSDERTAPAGAAAWLDAETVRTTNTSDQRLEVLLVEPKAAAGDQSGAAA